MRFLCLIVALGWIGVFWSPAAAQERFRVPTSVSSKVLGFAPLWAADKRGFFARENLAVDVTVTQGTVLSMQALVAESVDVALVANDGPIGLIEKGIDLTMIASASKSTHMILGQKDIHTYEDMCKFSRAEPILFEQ